MTSHHPDPHIAYLEAKKSVDDRALNRYVWQSLRAALPPSSGREPIRMVELGAGIGTMLQRVGQWQLTDHFDYTMVEIDSACLAAFRSGETRRSATLTWHAENRNRGRISFEHAEAAVATVCADLYDYLTAPAHRRRFHLIIAHAVMDLVDIETVLAGCRQIARPGGLLYLSLNYDRWTCLLPPVDPQFEQILFDRYHLSMDQRGADGRSRGGSRTGRLLFAGLQRHQMPILAAGGSDWIVYPRDGRYEEREDFFLESIVQTIHRQLRQDPDLDHQRLSAWVSERCAQIASGRLILIARNIDFLATVAH